MPPVERQDKVSNKDFYNTQRLSDRQRFEVLPGKIHALELSIPWIVSHLRPGDRVIDIAGGSGVHAGRVVRAAAVTVVGLDIAEGMVRQRLDDELLPYNIVGDMEALPFPDATFDAAMVLACLHHVPHPLPALEEAFRVLRPGGRLFTLDPNSLRARKQGMMPIDGYAHEFRLSVRWLAGQMRGVGFAIEEIRGANLTMRALGKVVPDPSLRLYHVVDAVDRALQLVPGLDSLAEIGMIRARKPEAV
jgi:SAM-dependent methyltransferase